ncbi:unnamed protein product [Brassica rapa subsp. trilocularis]|uniref:Uncharacterized protein n=1 Tax=Brassica campestris TaxID=3711 RepID=M4CB24_BRACM
MSIRFGKIIFFFFVALVLFVEASHARYQLPPITDLINGEIVELHPMMKKEANKKVKSRYIGGTRRFRVRKPSLNRMSMF